MQTVMLQKMKLNNAEETGIQMKINVAVQTDTQRVNVRTHTYIHTHMHMSNDFSIPCVSFSLTCKFLAACLN